ncbi:MAG: hypothetical protein GF384_02160, partial [Elusimicrobia bacterium]|nr:hypothetical protein [Elusimicrobiota bacterium]MBD3411783.1 hypothetical protein [Elusimicrobiota bacterium]
MSNIKTACITVLLVCFMGSVHVWPASEDDIGTSTLQFLKIGLGPRAMALGEAYTAVADDASSIYWNPAGLGRVTSIQIMTGYDQLLESITYGHVLIALPLGKKYVYGAGINHLRQPSLSKYDEHGNPLGSVKPQDTIALVSIAKTESILSVGCTLK